MKLYEKGLAYIDEVAVNWCPALGTVLANEEVIDGKSERGGHPVERRPMKQWMLRITAYADRLIDDLNDVDWPENIKDMQRNWIGRSEERRLHSISMALMKHSRCSRLVRIRYSVQHMPYWHLNIRLSIKLRRLIKGQQLKPI